MAPEVREAMLPYFGEHYGNPSSAYWAGVPAAEAVEEARAQVAGAAGRAPDEIVFTSGGTEADNTALKGVVEASGRERPHVVTTRGRAPGGAGVVPVPRAARRRRDRPAGRRHGPGGPGRGAPALRPATALVSVMHANNEVGTIEPIGEISRSPGRPGCFSTPTRRSRREGPAGVDELGVDLLSSPPTSSTGPRASARSTSAGAPGSSRSSTAGARSAGGGPAPRTSLDVGLGAAIELARGPRGPARSGSSRDRLWAELQPPTGPSAQRPPHPAAAQHAPRELLGRRRPRVLCGSTARGGRLHRLGLPQRRHRAVAGPGRHGRPARGRRRRRAFQPRPADEPRRSRAAARAARGGRASRVLSRRGGPARGPASCPRPAPRRWQYCAAG